MKRVKNLIKLTRLNSERLDENGLSHAIGGKCHCGCFYEACGGSTRSANDSENSSSGKVSPLPALNDPNWGIAT